MNWLIFIPFAQAEEATSAEKSSVAALDSVWTSGTTIGKGAIAAEVSFKHHSYAFGASDFYQRLKSQYPYTLTRYGLFKNTEIQLHLGIGDDCFYAEGYTPECSFGDTISFSDGEKFVGVGFKQSFNMGSFLTAYVYTHKDLQNIDDYYGGIGLQVNAGPLTSSLHTPSEYQVIEWDPSLQGYGYDEDFSGYSAIVQLESANRIEILKPSEKIPVQIDLLAAYSIPLYVRHTTTEKQIAYEGGGEESSEDIGFVYISNKRSYKGGLGFYLEDLGMYISTTMYSHLYFEIYPVVTQEDLDEAKAINFNEFIQENNGFHLMVSKTW